MIDNADKSLQTLTSQHSDLWKWVDNVSVTNSVEQKNAEELLQSIKSANKQAKDMLNSLLEPIKEAEKRTRSLFSQYLNRCETAKSKIEGLLSDFHKSQTELTEIEALERAEVYWKKVEGAKQTGEVVPLPDLGVLPPSKTSHHNMGSTSYRKHIKINVIQSNLVPREYCVPSESLIRKAGELALAQNIQLPQIDGVVMEIEYIPVSRSV
jgi:hypothetical protein